MAMAATGVCADHGRGVGHRAGDREAAAESGWKVAIARSRRDDAGAVPARSWAAPKRVLLAPSTSPTRRRQRGWWRRSAETLGGLDGVVNSAGIAADIHTLDTPVDLFRKILDVNVVGTFIVARAAARIDEGQGRRRDRQPRLHLRRARQQGAQRLRLIEGRRDAC